MTFKPRQSEFTPEFWAANQPDIARNADFLVANSNDMKWSDARAGASKAEVICQRAQKCEGDQTYDSNMQGNFLAGLGKGIIITKVLEGRGSDNVLYSAYGNSAYHNEGDKIQLQCKKGFANNHAKHQIQAECICSDGKCAWKKKIPNWNCVDGDNQQAMPWWSGAVFNFIEEVEPTYVTLKARVVNGVKLSTWTHHSVDTDKHKDWLKSEFWTKAPFTMFVFCPFNTKEGSTPTSGKGGMTFPDFYEAECSPDGRLCSFLSREGTVISRKKTDDQAHFKGYIDRSSVKDKQGPIEFVEGKKDIWTCETGILPGHQPTAITNLMVYFKPAFENGDFKNLLAYMRPNENKPTVDQL